MTAPTRRSFLVSAGAAAGAARVPGANDRACVAIIGAGGRGSYLMAGRLHIFRYGYTFPAAGTKNIADVIKAPSTPDGPMQN